MNWVYNDGGRAAAGFKGETRDCVVRAIAIATGKPYGEVYKEINVLCRDSKSSSRTGVNKNVTRAYLESLGWKWVPTMGIGTGCKMHLNADELPSGKIIAKVSRHLVAVIDGIVHDTYDCTRHANRCVYGYYFKNE